MEPLQTLALLMMGAAAFGPAAQVAAVVETLKSWAQASAANNGSVEHAANDACGSGVGG